MILLSLLVVTGLLLLESTIRILWVFSVIYLRSFVSISKSCVCVCVFISESLISILKGEKTKLKKKTKKGQLKSEKLIKRLIFLITYQCSVPNDGGSEGGGKKRKNKRIPTNKNINTYINHIQKVRKLRYNRAFPAQVAQLVKSQKGADSISSLGTYLRCSLDFH